MYSTHERYETMNDPTEFLLGRFRKIGKLGHFLTPTSACWLSGNSQFAVSYRENIVTLFDSKTGQEQCEIAYLSIEDRKTGKHSRQDVHTLA